jgi:hypothetical protein
LKLRKLMRRHTPGLSFWRSECHELRMMTMKAKALGGTVKSWALSMAVSVSCAPGIDSRRKKIALELTTLVAKRADDGRCKIPKSVERIAV